MLLYQQYGEIFRLDLIGAFDVNPIIPKRKLLTGLENVKIEQSSSSIVIISFARFVTKNAFKRQ